MFGRAANKNTTISAKSMDMGPGTHLGSNTTPSCTGHVTFGHGTQFPQEESRGCHGTEGWGSLIWNILRVHFLKWLCICFRVHIKSLTCGAFQDSSRASRVSWNYYCQDLPVFGYDPLPFRGPTSNALAPMRWAKCLSDKLACPLAHT